MMQSLRQSLYKLKHDRLLQNIGWLGSSEVLIRVSRLVATVILARFLTAEDYGLVAIAVCAAHLLVQPLYTLWATRVILKQLKTL